MSHFSITVYTVYGPSMISHENICRPDMSMSTANTTLDSILITGWMARTLAFLDAGCFHWINLNFRVQHSCYCRIYFLLPIIFVLTVQTFTNYTQNIHLRCTIANKIVISSTVHCKCKKIWQCGDSCETGSIPDVTDWAVTHRDPAQTDPNHWPGDRWSDSNSGLCCSWSFQHCP